MLFLGGIFLLGFLGGLLYKSWYSRFYSKPDLFRTEVSLEIGERVIYLHHIASITEEYVQSIFLTVCGFILGFAAYMMSFMLTNFPARGLQDNVFLSVMLTTFGGALGAMFSLSKQLVIHDASGTYHVLRLDDVERIELKQELTRDILKLDKE